MSPTGALRPPSDVPSPAAVASRGEDDSIIDGPGRPLDSQIDNQVARPCAAMLRRDNNHPSGRVMEPLSSSDGYSVPAAYAPRLAQLVRRWNVLPQDLLGGQELTEALVQEPHRRLSLPTYAALLERARALTGEPGLGFYIGLQKRVSGYGYLGFAAMSASSLGEALELVTRLSPVLTTSVTLRLQVEQSVAALVVEEHVDIGSARDIALIGLIYGMKQIVRMVTGREVPCAYVDLAIPEPDYFPRFKHLMPSARFDQPVAQ